MVNNLILIFGSCDLAKQHRYNIILRSSQGEAHAAMLIFYCFTLVAMI